MILRTLAVEGWRCFADRVSIGPLGDRINVLHAPNGRGKSTLMGALVRGLLDNHAAGGKAVEADLRPWGRELNPRVEIEFEHDGRRFQIVKQFLGSRRSELKQFEEGRFVALAEGEAADARVRKMLGGSLPTSRGQVDSKFWGWAQVLWAPQERLALPELDQSVAGAIRAALGAQAADPIVDAVERRIKDKYEAVFTKRGEGKLKSGQDAPPIVGLEQQLKDARQRCLELTERMAAFETAGRRIKDLRSRCDQLDRDEKEASSALESARKQAAEYDKLVADRDKHREAAKAAQARFNELQRQVDQIAAARRELREAREELARLEKETPSFEAELVLADAEADRARAKLNETAARRVELDETERRVKQARSFNRSQSQAADAEKRLGQLDPSRDELDKLTAHRVSLISPDRAALQAIRAQLDLQSRTQRELTAQLITVEIVPEREGELEILSGESAEPGPLTPGRLTPGMTRTVQGSPSVELRLPGVGVIRATGPSGAGGSVDELRARLADVNRELDAVAQRFGTLDLAALENRHDEAAELDKRIAELRVRIEALLGDRSADDLRREQSVAARVVEELAAQQPDWLASPPDADRLENELRQRREAFESEREQAVHAQNQALGTQARAKERLNLSRNNHKTTAQKTEDIGRRVEELSGLSSDEERQAELGRRALERTAADAAVAQSQERLDALSGNPRQEVETLTRRLAGLRAELGQLRQQLGNAEGQLESLVAEAPYSALAQVEERIGRFESDIAAHRRDNNAVRLLFETLRDRRAEAVGAVLGPVRRRATQVFHRIAGRPMGELRMSESFSPDGMTPPGSDDPIALAHVSGGEREQIHLAVRLALAETLFGGQSQRQLIVLDDVLTHTDAARLARVLEVLDETADTFQILVLTCHPERYRALNRAEFVGLEEPIAMGREEGRG